MFYVLQFNRLRYEVSKTGRGKIKEKFKLKEVEGRALDYLREEAVKGKSATAYYDILLSLNLVKPKNR